MPDPSGNGVKQGNIFQELPFLIDQDQACGDIIFHLYLLNLGSIFYGEFHLFRFQIAVRREFLPQRISFPCCQAFYHMFLPFDGNPGIFYISLTVKNCQRRALQFHAGCQICLFNSNGRRLILKFTAVLRHLYVLSLIRGRDIYRFIRRNISSRRFLLPDIIFPKRQLQFKDRFSILPCGCFAKQGIRFHNGFSIYHDIRFRIQTENSARNQSLIFCVFLDHGNLHFLTVIFKHGGLFHNRRILVCIGQGNRLLGFI